MFSRREFGRLALSGISGAALANAAGPFGSLLAQARPNSLIDGVQLGVITYSYRSMPDQSAQATLDYVVRSGINAIELMGNVVESFAGAPLPAPPAGRGGDGGRGPGGGRARGGAATPAATPPQPAAASNAPAPPGTWNGQPCPAPPAGRGGGRGRGQMTPEQQAAQREQAARLTAWRTSVSMEPFKKLRQMYNDAGVTIYAWKQLATNMSGEEMEYVFDVAEALGCTHTTLELPTDTAALKRIGDLALKKKIYAAYHTHTQGSMTAFDQAFAISKGNMANVDFGHWIAAPKPGGTPMQFLEKYHDRISSFHLKDRTTPEHCALNLPWGTGETPIREILRMVRANKWKIPATIELEYPIPEGSDAVAEVRKCLEYCRTVLSS